MSLKQVRQIKNKVVINGFQWDKGDGKLLFVTDQTGAVNIYNGETFSHQPLHVINDFHNGPCYAIAVDRANRFLVTGGTDSLIGLWDLADFMLIKSISNNDYKVMSVSVSHEGNFIASICEDDINKKYLVEVYDFDYNDPEMPSDTLYSYTSSYEKQLITWNPKRNVLAFAGEEKDSGVVHILNPGS